MNPIRNSVKAIIIKNDEILLIKLKNSKGIFYLLPGGGQEPEETFIETLKRECKEELGGTAEITIKDLLLIREYIGKNHEFAKYDMDVHQIEFMFECEINDDYTPSIGNIPDKMQLGSEWLKISELENHKIYPSVLKDIIKKIHVGEKTKIYLGDIN